MKETSAKIIPIFAAAASLVGGVIRFFQYVSVMDHKTGFFIKGAETAGLLIYIFIIAAAIAFLVLSAVRKKAGDAAYFFPSDAMGEIATQPLGISYLVAAVACLFELTRGQSGLGGQLLTIVPALLFAGTGFMLIKNIVPPKYLGAVHIVLALIWFLKTSMLFTTDLIIINHSDGLLRLMIYLLTTAFFASTARFYARLETKHSRSREINTAGLLLMISAVWVVGKCLALVFGGAAVKGMEPMDPNACTSLALSGTFIFVLFFTRGSKEIEYLVEKDKKKKKKGAESEEAKTSE